MYVFKPREKYVFPCKPYFSQYKMGSSWVYITRICEQDELKQAQYRKRNPLPETAQPVKMTGTFQKHEDNLPALAMGKDSIKRH